jgi:Ser/Thr protein kinase RdoA (MazF antagonist)
MTAIHDPATFLAEMHELAQTALDRWDLAATNLTPIKVRENAVFRIDLEGGGRAVLRVHRHGYHTDSALESEFAWLRALESSGIRVPRVIRSRDGRDFERVECRGAGSAASVRQVDVFEWIDGRQLGSIESGVAGDEDAVAAQYFQIGALAARMHDHTERWQPPPAFHRHSWDAAGLVGEAPLWGRFWELEALAPAERELLTRVRRALSLDLETFGRTPDRYGLIHADLIPENLLIDGERICVIDFDDAGYGWHLFELATSLFFISTESAYSAAREALIGGYRSERPLSDEAIGRLPLFLAARGTTYLGWVHTREGTETARELTPYLVERACAVAEEYLRGR